MSIRKHVKEGECQYRAGQPGVPLRIYIPQPKWIDSIEAMDHWEPGYWVDRGWDSEGQMRATSVIDTVAVDMMIGQANEKTLIAVGGIAHAGSRGISKVEVKGKVVRGDGPQYDRRCRKRLG